MHTQDNPALIGIFLTDCLRVQLRLLPALREMGRRSQMRHFPLDMKDGSMRGGSSHELFLELQGPGQSVKLVADR